MVLFCVSAREKTRFLSDSNSGVDFRDWANQTGTAQKSKRPWMGVRCLFFAFFQKLIKKGGGYPPKSAKILCLRFLKKVTFLGPSTPILLWDFQKKNSVFSTFFDLQNWWKKCVFFWSFFGVFDRNSGVKKQAKSTPKKGQKPPLAGGWKNAFFWPFF